MTTKTIKTILFASLIATLILPFSGMQYASAETISDEIVNDRSFGQEELKKYGRDDIMVIVGGVIPKQDYQYLFDAGAVAVFGPGTKISDAAIKILEILIE